MLVINREALLDAYCYNYNEQFKRTLDNHMRYYVCVPSDYNVDGEYQTIIKQNAFKQPIHYRYILIPDSFIEIKSSDKIESEIKFKEYIYSTGGDDKLYIKWI